MARRRSAAFAIAAAVVLWSGCGGPMQPDELARSIGMLESSAADGALRVGFDGEGVAVGS
jgi:hypothetical protein